jgi:hypothetical protein
MGHMEKPRVFIGSSTEGKRIARAMHRLLSDCSEPKLWDQGVFLPGRFAIEDLEGQLRASNFAVFVATPDDEVTKRGETSLIMRDNVLFEFGLFIGILGRRRVFLAVPDDPKIEIPSDLSGIGLGEYNCARSIRKDDSEVVAAVQIAADNIVSAIRQEWERVRAEDEARRRRIQASQRGQAIQRLYGVAVRLRDAVLAIQRESLQNLLVEHTFDSVKAAAIEKVVQAAESFRPDAEIAGAVPQLEQLRNATVHALSDFLHPRQIIDPRSAVSAVLNVAARAAAAHATGADAKEAARYFATRKAKPHFEALVDAYSLWWERHRQPLERATDDMRDALFYASMQLGIDAAGDRAASALAP